MVFVEEIVTKPEGYEWILTVSDGVIKLHCDTYRGSEFSSGDKFDEEILAYGIKNIYKSNVHKFFVGNNELTQKQHINAKVVDVINRIVRVGNHKIILGEDVIPGDILDEDFIEFDVDYLAVY